MKSLYPLSSKVMENINLNYKNLEDKLVCEQEE